MEFEKLCLKRESCRSYTGERVPQAVLRNMVEACRVAPSACNNQPWRLYVADSEEALKAVSDAVTFFGTNKFAEKAGAFIVIEGVEEIYPERVRESLCGRRFDDIDIGICAAFMTLAASDLGYGTCIIGCFNEAVIKAAVGADEKANIKLVLAVGRPSDAEPRKKTRKTTEDIVKFGL